MHKSVKNITGHRTVFLKVIEYSHSEKWKAYWKCKCDCGQEVILPTSALTGQKANKSCGRCSLARRRKPDRERVRAHVLLRYKNSPVNRDHTWMLSDDEVWALVLGSCHWCGAAPEIRKMWEADKRNRTIEYPINGIDRMDSKKGYVTSNVVTSCNQCNRAKKTLSPKDFLAHVAKIVEFQNRHN